MSATERSQPPPGALDRAGLPASFQERMGQLGALTPLPAAQGPCSRGAQGRGGTAGASPTRHLGPGACPRPAGCCRKRSARDSRPRSPAGALTGMGGRRNLPALCLPCSSPVLINWCYKYDSSGANLSLIQRRTQKEIRKIESFKSWARRR